ncbi:MAG: IS1634 family transposase, partial [Candidatus Acidifodinimicrobium sp.]
MTYVRRQVRNGKIYLYEARTFRDKETGKVKQEVKYLGKEVEKDGKKVLQPPKDRYSVRRILDSAGYVLYYTAVDEGFLSQYDDALKYHTRIKDAAKKILILAAETVVGPGHSIPLHTGVEMSEKEIRDVIELIGGKDPDIVSILERSMASDIMRKYGSSGIVYDLSAIRYYGTENDLARYGHYYHLNGENREINFVLAVTRKGGVPVHHRVVPGNIPSVSTVSSFSREIKDFGIFPILIVIDRGFYSSQNMKELKDYGVIGALPSSLTIYENLIKESKDMDNSRNYMQYDGETIFHREERIGGTRYIVFFSPRLRSRKMESFYTQLDEKESQLKELMNKSFDSKADMIKTVEYVLNGFRTFIDVNYG